MTTRHTPRAHHDPILDELESETEAEMVAAIRAARQQGTLRAGALPVDRTVSVTIRMSGAMVAELKEEAARQGVRGYQTLLKQWIEERLAGEPMVSARELAKMIRPLERVFRSPTKEFESAGAHYQTEPKAIRKVAPRKPVG